MKTLMIACSVIALAGAAGIATTHTAQAGFFDKQTVSGSHRHATHLPEVPYYWTRQVNSLPSWWYRNENANIPGSGPAAS